MFRRTHPIRPPAIARAFVVAVTTVAVTAGAGCAATTSQPEAGTGAAGQERQTATQQAQPKRQHETEGAAPRHGAPPEKGTAAARLAALRVRGRAPMTGYDRDRFGQAWLDADRNGCDTRNDILLRDLSHTVAKDGTGGCVILTGQLDDPYTGTRRRFVRAETYNVDIDHVVALGNAWASGAWRWDITKRAALANDPLNLLAVDAGENRSKGAGDAATWLPPNRDYRCTYVARQVTVKAKYRLSTTPAEHDAIARILATCPGQRVAPDPTHAPTRVDQQITDPGAPTQAPPASDPGAGTGTVHYDNCDAARAAGAAPLHTGDPGYGRHLDRDGDGTACE